MNMNPFEELRCRFKKVIEGKSIPTELQIIQYRNGKNIRTPYSFRYEDIQHPKLKELREKYRLEEVVRKGKTEMEKFILLRDWVCSRWNHGWDDIKMGSPPKDALSILREAKRGKQFHCVFYSKVLVQCAISLGYQARRLIIRKDISHIPLRNFYKEVNTGHHIAEIWSNEYNKWIVMDPDLNAHYEKDGIPLNAYEIRQAWLEGWWKEIKFVQGESLPAFLTNPSMYHEKARKELEVFTRYNSMDYYHHISVELGNNYFSSDENIPRLWWVDKFTPPHLIDPPWVPLRDSYWTTNIFDMYWTLNQTIIGLECFGDNYSTLKVNLETFTPGFSKFLVKIDDNDWQESRDSLLWPLREGQNTIQARAVNKLGVAGAISEIIIKYKK